MLNKTNAPEGAVEVFNFSQQRTPVRVRLVDGEPWFVAVDVCQILGIGNNREAIKRLDEDECMDGVSITDAIGRTQRASMVNESGLYHLVFQSRKAEAQKFRKWVTSEVLPAIRKKGFYGLRKKAQDYTDARDIPHARVIGPNGQTIRVVEIDGVKWYSINDVNRCLEVSTESSQCARKLNARQTLAIKIWIRGVTQPGWFASELGVRLLLCGSAKTPAPAQLLLSFDGKEVAR